MAGRPPKPTALKLLTGNPGRRPLPKNEPKPPAGKAEPPDWLSPMARKLWDKYAPRYEAMGTLTSADELAFANWMILQARIAILEREGESVSNETLAKCLAYATAFGGTGSGRARISIEPKKPESKLGRFMDAAKR